ncbi:FadR/GntR family transcriptional regulator [Mycetocola reblochoni]|uniref:FadR family transcriptional regulator n=1 Tax=Mycetocola reblochoni TaxID=331618 RepID=A0A3L6ZKE2_9MICO|nr:FCD domain-containing protein [Mycetocola reblochoni]RLP68459.1 FadR family transcriptional regulator [Mycetocola reblochoni]
MTSVPRRTTPAAVKVHDTILDRLGERIVSGQVPAGERLVAADWGEELGASRTAVREAVRVLESLGMVSVRRKSGITIRPSTDWMAFAPEIVRWRLRGAGRLVQLHELSELRAAVEPAAARLAASTADGVARAALGAAVQDMVTHADRANGADYLAADVRFHATLLRASGNSMFAGLTAVIEEVLVGRTEQELMPQTADETALRLHQEVAHAITRRDGEAAARAMTAIVDEADRAVQSLPL